MKNRLLLLIPLAAFVAIAGFAFKGLTSLDQSSLPSNLIDTPAPEFDLADMPGLGPAFTREDVEGEVTLVNVFGSWCVACRIEHPMLLEIGPREDIRLFGINWMDEPERGAKWLEEHGNPYDRVGNDMAGRNIIDLGVTGAPETFLIDRAGRIRYRHTGPITEEVWKETLLPKVRALKAESGA